MSLLVASILVFAAPPGGRVHSDVSLVAAPRSTLSARTALAGPVGPPSHVPFPHLIRQRDRRRSHHDDRNAVWHQSPSSLRCGFDGHALYGPVRLRAVLYPSDLTPPGHSVGDAVEVDFKGEGPWILRLALDAALLPPAARPARVRVLRKNLLFGWSVVPALWQEGEAGQHALYVRLNKPGHYGVVVGARSSPPPAQALVDWAMAQVTSAARARGGEDVTGRVTAAVTRIAGARRVIAVHHPRKLAGLLAGTLRFFKQPPSDVPMVLGHSTAYLLAPPVE